ncbi:MAG: TIM-barrel domain-containing protein [Pseudomonadota bacterium]
MSHFCLLPLLFCACRPSELTVGGFLVTLHRDDGRLDLVHAARGDAVTGLAFATGTGSFSVEEAFGSYRFDDERADLVAATGQERPEVGADAVTLGLLDADGASLGRLTLTPEGPDTLVLDWVPADPGADRVEISADCGSDEHFLGLGGHAMDVDHVGQAFPLWVSEPGVGKVEDEDPPDDWSLTGTRHASSYPVPFLLRPQEADGLLAETWARTQVDLCATDPGRFSLLAWEGPLRLAILSGDGPLEVVQALTARTGRIEAPPAWALGAWADAVGGSQHVREVAATLREAGASVSAIWTEDWKGFQSTPTGYRLSNEWFVDRELYPDAEGVGAELEADGFAWLAYFSPFLAEGTTTWQSAAEAGVLIGDDAGDPCTFLGVTLKDSSVVDLTDPGAEAWALGWMDAARALGFSGWMADYGEWLPTGCPLADGDPMLEHQRYPERWQRLNAVALPGNDEVFFARSGWNGAQGVAPLVWGGDQRTSFDTDDGLPTVLAQGLGLAASGVPLFTHDIAGYQSVGNDPADRELWYRWTSLGVYTPLMRTHHGAFDEENWHFDEDAETLAFFVDATRAHTRLYPYLSGLAREAAEDGSPAIRPVAFHHGRDWGRMDAWMLGPALLVAPVLERGVSGREVELPSDVAWWTWPGQQPAQSGWFDVALDEIPVFCPEGTTLPLLAEAPDTLRYGASGITDLDAVDGERVVILCGGGGGFSEGDGTTYQPRGAPTGSGETTATLQSGTVEVAGLTLEIAGPRVRVYRVVVVR